MSTDTFMTASSYLAAYRALLGLLVSEECVADYRVEGSSVTVQWHNSGFDRVLQEVKKNEKPFSLAGKDRVCLIMLLWECRKDRVTPEILVPLMNERMTRHPNWSFMDIFFRKNK